MKQADSIGQDAIGSNLNTLRMEGASIMAIPDTITAQEDWRPIPGYEGLYSVSNLGQVRRDSPARGHQAGFILKAHIDVYGYQYLVLYREGVRKKWRIHRLVALVFIGEPAEGMTVNHIDGNKCNNCPQNLEYLTAAENSRHAARLGLLASGERSGPRKQIHKMSRGERHGRARLTDEDIIAIRKLIGEGLAHGIIAKRYGVTRSLISAIGRGVIWRHI